VRHLGQPLLENRGIRGEQPPPHRAGPGFVVAAADLNLATASPGAGAPQRCGVDSVDKAVDDLIQLVVRQWAPGATVVGEGGVNRGQGVLVLDKQGAPGDRRDDAVAQQTVGEHLRDPRQPTGQGEAEAHLT
jgi:hypothetical protein